MSDTPEDHRMAELAAILTTIHEARPRASLLYARIVLKLLDAPDRTMSVSDLSDTIGRGRDSSAIQQAVSFMVEAKLATREMLPPDGDAGRRWLVQLTKPKAPSRRRPRAADAAAAGA